MLHLSFVSPPADPELERVFTDGLTRSYRHFGVEAAVYRPNEDQGRAITHIVVCDREGVAVGGARLHRAGRRAPLPALRALASEPALRSALVGDAARIGPPVELASLWVARRPQFRGLGRLIARASIAGAAVGGATRAVTFSHETIEPLLVGIGMRPVRDAPQIAFPSPLYKSTIYEIAPGAPTHALDADRAQIEAITAYWSDHPATPLAVAPAPGPADEGARWTVLIPGRAVVAA